MRRILLQLHTRSAKIAAGVLCEPVVPQRCGEKRELHRGQKTSERWERHCLVAEKGQVRPQSRTEREMSELSEG